MLILYLKATNHNSLHYIDFDNMQRYKSLAICAPQSLRFSLSFSPRKLFAPVKGRRGDSIGSLFFCISLHNSTQRFGHTAMSLRASYTAEQGLIPSYNFIREQRLGVILKAHSLAQISKKPTATQKSTSVCLAVLSLTDITLQRILYGCKIAI